MADDLLFKASMYRAQGKSLKEEQRKEVQLAARQAGYVYDEQKQDYTPSPENYQAQAMAAMAEQLKSMQATMMNNETWNTLTSDVQAGSYDGMNALIQKPEYKKLFEPMGVTGVRQLSRDNASDMEMLKNNFAQLGYKGGDLDTLLTITQDEEQWKNFRTAFPVVIGPDGKSKITSLADVNMVLGGARRTDANNTSKLLGDQYALGVNALSGKLSSLVEAEKNRVVAAAGTEQLKLEDMETFLANNPEASLADYIQKSKYRDSYGAGGGVKPSSLEKEAEYIKQQYGDDAAQQYINKKITGASAETGTMKNEKYNVGVINTIKQEAGVQDMWDVDYTKLSPDSRTRFDKLVQEDRKYIKAEELEGLASFEAAANKLNVEDLAKTTGIADAAFNSVLDRLGLDLPDETLVQSANYNIIKNTIIKAAMGSQVTGNELERMKAQLGTEFRADKTVRVKMAETLDNLVAKYDSYKVSAPHIYARLMKDKVNNMKDISNYLRNPDAKPKVEGATEPTQPTQTGGQGTKVKVGQIVNGYQYIGGEANNPKSWKKVGQ